MSESPKSPLDWYNDLKKSVKESLYSDELSKILNSCFESCIDFLHDADKLALISKVPGKEYFGFTKNGRVSRAINKNLFSADKSLFKHFQQKMSSDSFSTNDISLINSTLYSMAISFCACVDLLKTGDQKTPGTFFEYFVAYFFSWRVGIKPSNRIRILNIDDENTSLPTDFVFNLGPKKAKFHMPVKTSTRERSIMLWAHQKLIDGVYGQERFMGTPVLLAETKTSKKTKEVVEICLPDQWRLYQLYVAKLKRIYYLDLPRAYENLNTEFPPLAVRPFADFFLEYKDLAPI